MDECKPLIVGRLSLEWGDHLLTGIACNLESPAYKLMCEAIQEVTVGWCRLTVSNPC